MFPVSRFFAGGLVFFVAFSAESFCVQSFNAYGPAYSLDNEARTLQWAMEIAEPSRKCSLVQLQEVWSTSHSDLVESILGPFFRTVLSANRRHRIGIMSFIEGVSSETQVHLYRMNNDGGLFDDVREIFGVEKAFSASRVKLNDLDEGVWAVNTHLHPTSAAVRITQILELAEWRHTHADLKMILNGDFNFAKNGLERALLLELLGAVDAAETFFGGRYSEDFCTYCAANPRSWLSGNHVFDYVFVSNIGGADRQLVAKSVELNLTGTPDFTYSDHYGLRVELELEERGRGNGPRLEERRGHALRVLQRAQRVLTRHGVRMEEFSVKLAHFALQLESRQGRFWDYFRAFR